MGETLRRTLLVLTAALVVAFALLLVVAFFGCGPSCGAHGVGCPSGHCCTEPLQCCYGACCTDAGVAVGNQWGPNG